jgi:hypothetical protein
MKAVHILAIAATLLGSAHFEAFGQSTTSPGRIRFTQRTSSDWDQFTANPSASFISWINQKMNRVQVYEPFFDSRLSWYKNAWSYQDLYGVSGGDNLVRQHPEWILKDSNNNWLYLPWGCSGGTCPLYAFDPGNPDFRNWWIQNRGKVAMSAGYKGLWIDDVNLEFRVGDRNGTETVPIDPRTGAPMTYAAWKGYVAGFTQAIRSALPNAEIVHNSIWFAGGSNRDYDPNVIKEIQAADFINCERGISDGGLTGGDGIWSVNAFLAFVDHVHSLGKHVIFDEYTFNGEYGAAGYYLISDGLDGFGNHEVSPDSWDSLYDADLGTPQGDRYTWNNLLVRNFSAGWVLLNPNRAAAVTVPVSGAFRRADGSAVSGTLRLNGGEGAVLLNPNASAATAAPVLANGTYTITGRSNNYVLDDPAFSVASGTQIIQWSLNGDSNQLWRFMDNGSGQFTIQSAFSGLYLADVNGQLQQVAQNNGSSQLWTVKATASGIYTLTNVSTGRVIDNPASSTKQGTGMITYSANGGQNQNWAIKAAN